MAARTTVQALVKAGIRVRGHVPTNMIARSGRSYPAYAGYSSLFALRWTSAPNITCPVLLRSMSGAASGSVPKKASSYKEYFERSKEDLFNIVLSCLFFIVTLQMLRTKGDKLDDEMRHKAREEELQNEIQRLKTKVVEAVESGAPEIAQSLGLWKSSSDELKKKMLVLISKAVKDPSSDDTTHDDDSQLRAIADSGTVTTKSGLM